MTKQILSFLLVVFSLDCVAFVRLQHSPFFYIGQPATTSLDLSILGGYRFYNPLKGQFLKQDSLTPFYAEQTFNSFDYASGNPLLRSDKTGHMEAEIIGLVEEEVQAEENLANRTTEEFPVANEFDSAALVHLPTPARSARSRVPVQQRTLVELPTGTSIPISGLGEVRGITTEDNRIDSVARENLFNGRARFSANGEPEDRIAGKRRY